MKVLIAGGSGLLGRALTDSLLRDGHDVLILSRRAIDLEQAQVLRWDGASVQGWASVINEVDAVVNLCGKSLAAWPWTRAARRRFLSSRVEPAAALVSAVAAAQRPPAVFVQASGVNYYGLEGGPADESTAPGGDFLARLAVEWERMTERLEAQGVRRIVIRSAVILDRRGGLLPLMALSLRLFVGGPIGHGRQALPWIHLTDEVRAVRLLLEEPRARGAYNLIAPDSTTNAEFMQTLASVLRRPYWLRAPGAVLKMVLGGMSDLILYGRVIRPSRLAELGFEFRYSTAADALQAIYGSG